MDETKKPLVSVALATYNGEKFIEQQLDSIFQQTYTNIELIVVDDASSDSTLNILHAYRLKHSNMKVFSNETNLGFIKNFEKACSLANGDLISPCDQDDVWHTDKIKLMVEAIEDYPLIYCDSYICNEDLQQTRKKISDIVNCKTWNNCLQYAVFARIYGHTLLFTRKLLQNIIPFTEVIPHDWWIAYNALLNGSIKFLNEPLVYYRQHKENAFGIVGQKARKTALSKHEKKLLEEDKSRERIKLFYKLCPDRLTEEKNVLKQLMDSYEDFSISNNLKRMQLFFKYKHLLLAPKKYTELRRDLFCLKMFVKIK